MNRLLLRLITAVQLTRVTMAFGAVGDIWFIILWTRAMSESFPELSIAAMPLAVALLVGAIVSTGLFAYGASLNDVLDVRHDTAFSPERPIPAGRIRSSQAVAVTVITLLVAILAAAYIGEWGLRMTMITALGILFYNTTMKYIPAARFISIGLIYVAHMLIPNVQFTFTMPLWLIMTHVMVIELAAYSLQTKRPRISGAAIVWTIVGWVFWSAVILGWGMMRSTPWPEGITLSGFIWPILAVGGFVAIARIKTAHVTGTVAAEKMRRYGALWQCLYGVSWLLLAGFTEQALWLGGFAVLGFVTMTLLKEIRGVVDQPLTYRL